MSKSKAKGTAAETAVVKYLNEQGIRAVRKPLHGTNDEGDVDIYPIPMVIEVKNCATMKLSEWIKEAETERDNAGAAVGVVWHKKRGAQDPKNWYVTMSGEALIRILHGTFSSLN